MASMLDTTSLRLSALARGEAALHSLGLSTEQFDRVRPLLASAADPEAVVHYLVSLKQQNGDVFRELLEAPAELKYFLTVASFSRFLSEEILQHPEWLKAVRGMSRVLAAGEYRKRLGKFLKDQPDGIPLALSLALFRR